ncbi:MAG: 4Fe-4S dicluster domain-containing protein [Clostridia bacterium]|nr:4Fe-4S dicluster domain-containing protein [Clostridia bacterium]
MRVFDTKVQYLKYQVLKEVSGQAWKDTLMQNFQEIPKIIVPGDEPTMRCCVNKERAILAERVKMAMGGTRENPNNIEVLPMACDKCPASGYEVIADSCRNCLAHSCEQSCKFGAIYFDRDHRAHIDKDKCKNCGQCAQSCSFSAIVKRERPCMKACKVKAISAEGGKSASIDNSKCIQCGACVYKCPFGAITDKSYILNVIDLLKKSAQGKGRVYAIVAPAIYSQFKYAALGQVVSGLKALGFHTVVEAALGGDMVALKESRELSEKGFLTTSCCPAFVAYIKSAMPDMLEHVSHNYSPMVEMSKFIKEMDKDAKCVFIGPCTAKKGEAKLEKSKPYVDEVLTFEELQALFDSREIELEKLPEDVLDNASYYGRIFARSGGVSEAAAQALKEQGIDFEAKPLVCNGIEECTKALLMAQKKLKAGQMPDYNFIEGMACVGGCINGAGCLTHSEVKNKLEVDKYGREAMEKSIKDAVDAVTM